MPESFDIRPTLARRFDDDVTRQKETANLGKLAVSRGLILRLGGPQKYSTQRNSPDFGVELY